MRYTDIIWSYVIDHFKNLDCGPVSMRFIKEREGAGGEEARAQRRRRRVVLLAVTRTPTSNTGGLLSTNHN